MNSLKLKSFKSVAFKLILFFIFGCFLIVLTLPSLLGYSTRYTNEEAFPLLLMGGIFLLIVILFSVWILTGQYQKSVKRYVSGSMNSALAKEKINHFIKNTPEIKGLRYNHEFICGNHNGTIAFGETSKLAWVYLSIISHKHYFVTVNKSYVLVLGFTDGHLQVAKANNENGANELMQKLSSLCPQAIVGYKEELHTLYKKDLNKFLQLKYYKVLPPDRA